MLFSGDHFQILLLESDIANEAITFFVVALNLQICKVLNIFLMLTLLSATVYRL